MLIWLGFYSQVSEDGKTIVTGGMRSGGTAMDMQKFSDGMVPNGYNLVILYLDSQVKVMVGLLQ